MGTDGKFFAGGSPAIALVFSGGNGYNDIQTERKKNTMKKGLCIFLLCLLLAGCAAAAEPVETTLQTTAQTTVPTAETTQPAAEQTPITEPAAPDPQVLDTVPVYYQTDYPYIRYGNGTIGSGGCGITCLAMAATYVTDRVYTPDMIAWEFGGYGENNIQRLDYAIAQMQLPCRKNTDWQETKQALQAGKIAIILVDERSLFTQSSHFVLLTGINDQGRYLVTDPFEPNYSEAYLKEHFEKGFPEHLIVAGLEGSWVFDKEARSDFLYEIEKPACMPTRYEGFEPGEKDIDYLARFVWAAAREEEPRLQQAVAELVLNRMVSDRYPDRVEDVMSQEELYVWYRQISRAQPDLYQYQAVTNALYGPHVLPVEVVHGAPWPVGGGEEWGKLGSFTFSFEKKESM